MILNSRVNQIENNIPNNIKPTNDFLGNSLLYVFVNGDYTNHPDLPENWTIKNWFEAGMIKDGNWFYYLYGGPIQDRPLVESILYDFLQNHKNSGQIQDFRIRYNDVI